MQLGSQFIKVVVVTFTSFNSTPFEYFTELFVSFSDTSNEFLFFRVL